MSSDNSGQLSHSVAEGDWEVAKRREKKSRVWHRLARPGFKVAGNQLVFFLASGFK